MPFNARVVAFKFVMSMPLNSMVPESMLYAGFPAIVCAMVDLPEPLWPDNKWRSPRLICRQIFVSNFLSPNDTDNFFMFSIFNPLIMPFG